MSMYVYGEDGLTLWALKRKLGCILKQAGDNSSAEECIVFYRPSFGRSGGNKSAQFGEFDFIILSKKTLYLGESKWDRSSENNNGVVTLRNEQLIRHNLFKTYVEEWFVKNYEDWDSFANHVADKFVSHNKRIAPSGSLLSENLITILKIIKSHFNSCPQVINLLLIFSDGNTNTRSADPDFHCVNIDYSSAPKKHLFIEI